MKNLKILLFAFVMITSCSNSSKKDDDKLKRYDVKSGIVNYRITGSGNMMGSSISEEGTARCVFKDSGATELREEESTTTTVVKIPFAGTKRDVQSSHTLDKLISGKSYSVDFEEQVIYESDDMPMNFIKAFYPNQDAGDFGQKGLEAMGGKKIGTEKVLGYPCDIWELMGVKQWIYKGVPLKIEGNIAGLLTVQEAVSATFDVDISDKDLQLPDYPVKRLSSFIENDDASDDFNEDMEIEQMKEELKKIQKMSFKEWKKTVQGNDPEMRELSDEELKEIYDMSKKAAKFIL
ncbi:hypothetical protein C7377_0832 [Balneicella halophila]|uniref:Uncharacterized protein n=1 Tax=Balneicella halophila TaxID=1537566 RepID=A0A7L4URV3_BALHA|nr:hypothetical protein [Balneicella halophila]PVX52508.1 hypothetical protein C7377_0832 [Balneicella halophila]